MSVVMETESVRSGRSERSERSQQPGGSRHHQRPHRSHSGGRDRSVMRRRDHAQWTSNPIPGAPVHLHSAQGCQPGKTSEKKST